MIFKWISNVCVGTKYSLDEIVSIVRPVIYVWCVMKFGRKSWTPIKISAILDLVQIVIGITRLSRSNFYEQK
jgi:mannose/fructose/N-acetylgalactosamine-specific phosphotransferase system component IID